MDATRVLIAACALSVVGTLVLAGTAMATAPIASFNLAPSTPAIDETVTFTSTSTDKEGDITTTEWDFDYNGTFTVDATGANATHSYPTAGDKTVRLRVTDGIAGDGTMHTAETSRTVNVQANPPQASFTFSPPQPLSLQSVTFTSTSTPPNNPANSTINSLTWDLDNDGQFDDAANSPVSRTFLTPGTKIVRVRATATNGDEDIQSGQVVVGNRGPSATFRISPEPAQSEEEVTLTSTAVDPDGAIASHSWDLDNDGQFDDGRGPTVRRAYSGPARLPVRLQVLDSNGAVATGTRTLVVLEPGSASSAPLISPFPVVRIVGSFTRTGARLRLFAIKAPSGSQVVVRCRGPRCPFRRRSRKAGSKRLRFKSLERRLRARVRIGVFVTKPGFIGKYTRFRIRRGKAPARSDRCLMPDRPMTPRACP